MNNVNNPPITSSLGGVTTQTDVHLSRACDATVYHNTSSKPMFVLIALHLGLNEYADFYADVNAAPTLKVNHMGYAGTATPENILSFGSWVLAGNYYKCNVSASGTIFLWTEYV